MLRLENISASYGAVRALDNVSIDVAEGEIVTLIGANGAGKSTLLMTICGNPRAELGTVWLNGRDITALPTHQIAALGIAHAPEGRRIFARMTVRENLQLGARLRDPGRFGANLDSVVALFPRLKERLDQRGGTLSGGEQQMLAIGRALLSRPKLLMLDEPSLGLAPNLVREIFRIIETINRDSGTAVLLVEQNANQALGVAHRGYVLETGRITLKGPADELRANPEVKKAYLGE